MNVRYPCCFLQLIYTPVLSSIDVENPTARRSFSEWDCGTLMGHQLDMNGTLKMNTRDIHHVEMFVSYEKNMDDDGV